MIDIPQIHPDRDANLQEQIDTLFVDLIDQFCISGFGTIETIDAMQEVLRHRRRMYAEDPDPSEDTVIPEPANDWPSA